jgi:exodeoxyribonuclease VII large subunit
MSARASESRVRLAVLRSGVESAARARLDESRARAAVAAASLDALSPLAVLGRGYALAEDGRGAILRGARTVEVGDAVRVRLSEGVLRCRVEGVEGVEKE